MEGQSGKTSKGRLCQIWLIGKPEELEFYWDYLLKLLSKTSGDPRAFVKGQLTIDYKTYQMELSQKIISEVDLENPPVDGILFYGENDLGNSWVENSKFVKTVGFLEAEHRIYENDTYYFSKTDQKFNLDLEFERFLKQVVGPKEVKPAHPAIFDVEAESDLIDENSEKPHPVYEEVDEKKMDEIRKDLKEFLSLKYKFTGPELYDKIENGGYEQKLNNWPAIRRVLDVGERPRLREITKAKTQRPVRVVLSEHDNDPKRNFELLKAAAYYPFQYDPWPGQWADLWDIDRMSQVALACHYGRWDARFYLRESLNLVFHQAPKNHPFRAEFSPIHQKDLYYDLPYPLDDDGKAEKEFKKRPLDFNPEEDWKETVAFCDYLLELAITGKRPK